MAAKSTKDVKSKVNMSGGYFPTSSKPAGSKTQMNKVVKNASGGNFPKKSGRG